MKIKKMTAMLAASTMITSMILPTNVWADDVITLTYAEVNSIDSLDGLVAQYFKEQVEELTEGSVTIDIQASAVLGVENDVLDGMTSYSGMIDLARISVFALNNYGCELSQLVAIPFTFENRDHYWAFTESELAAQLLEEPAEKGNGFRGMCYLEEGFRNFFFTNEVAGIDDLQNLKIRVSSDPIMTGMTEALGASPTVIAFNELYTSLQSGVVDGGDQPTALYESNAFYEVSPYLLKDEHTLSVSTIVMTDMAMDKLSDEQMEALEEAFALTSVYCHEISAQMEAESEERLLAEGVTITEIEDKTPWREACTDLIAEYTVGLEDEYQEILSLAE